jgi:lipoprotein-anchoring transpeptidase ErfK/SrfK
MAHQTPQPATLYEWWGDGVPGQPSIRINLATQKAQFFRGGKPVGWTIVATGTSNYPTRPGRFRILNKEVDRISYTYGTIVDADGDVIDHDARSGREAIPSGGRFEGSPMPYWMQITSYGIGMHAGVIPRPGRPASHGCIRLPRKMAIKFFEIAPVGTPVTIVHQPGEDDPWGTGPGGNEDDEAED